MYMRIMPKKDVSKSYLELVVIALMTFYNVGNLEIISRR